MTAFSSSPDAIGKLSALPDQGTPEEPGRTASFDPAHGWPPQCSLAELARILTMLHGHQAPTESSLKKWSAAGEFADCVETARDVAEPARGSLTCEVLARRPRGGRPGLRLHTQRAIERVYAQWPHLQGTGAHVALDLAAARAADQLEARLGPVLSAAGTAPQVVAAHREEGGEAIKELLEQMTSLRNEMAGIRREMAQFSAMRNNLITKLDNAVSRAQESISGGGHAGASTDPLAEARHNRDMGVLKSMLGEILAAVTKGD